MKKETASLFSRYLFVLFFGIFLFQPFSSLVQFSTHYFATGLLSFFHPLLSFENKFLINEQIFEIIPACGAASAYYLLLLLSFSMPLTPAKRLKLLLAVFGMFFFLNAIRIVLLVEIYKKPYFTILHWVTWHFISGLLIFLIWIFSAKKLKIQSKPFVEDFKTILQNQSV